MQQRKTSCVRRRTPSGFELRSRGLLELLFRALHLLNMLLLIHVVKLCVEGLVGDLLVERLQRLGLVVPIGLEVLVGDLLLDGDTFASVTV